MTGSYMVNSNFYLVDSDGTILSFNGPISWNKAFSLFKFHCDFYGISGEIFIGGRFIRKVGKIK